ncbi:TPA: alcohol dehydrogenase, partial [Candidatus Bathyarchaeota archaeon]|nr:alcohol dehydrogenase [Candidatus Bathyarchaeota archaeon]
MTMRGAVIVRSHDLVVKETPIPEIGPGDVLVKVKACGVCKTDIHIYEGTFPAALPLIPGHEFSGEVAAVGPGVEGIDVGDKVIVDPNVSCGKCYYCRTARRHFCANWEGMGLTMDGAYAEYVRAPASVVYEMPDGMSFEEGAFTEP